MTTLGSNWAIAVALGMTISPLALAWILAVVSVLQVLPVSIGGVGVREVTLVGLLGLYGVPASQSLPFAVLVFCVSVVLGLTGWALDAIAASRNVSRALPAGGPPPQGGS
jgi:uncharacterized membrane protein YbhN (UPF0104 family)